MKHIKLFENFGSSKMFTPEENNIFYRILDLSKQQWFINGDDCPEEVFKEFNNISVDINNPDLLELAELTAGGPGYTDVDLMSGDLISDLTSGYSRREIEENIIPGIDENNRSFFEHERKRLIEQIEKEGLPIVRFERISK
jgi:hypothetical protein